MTEKLKIFLTGAGGRTGCLVLEKLRARPDIFVEVKGLVRRSEQATELGPDIHVGDVRQPETYEAQMAQCDRLIILTSAVPKMRPRDNPSDPPSFYFEPDEMPEQVDWLGQRAQIDLAVRHGYKQVVLVSSMGVTKPDHPLNRIGDGKILFWKRMAEEYLANSGVPYTIIHPGGLQDKPGGKRELLVGKHDQFMETGTRTIPRADLAEVVVQALLHEAALNKSFDIVSREEGQGQPTWEFDVLFDQATAGV